MIKNLADKLKQLRTLNNLSQKEVSKRLNVSPSIVSGYETGERTPSTEKILALSYLYNCSTDYLLGKSAEQPQVALDTEGLSSQQLQALQALINTMRT